MEQKWSFRKITSIEEPVFNHVLEKFYDLGVDGLVRENIQNSLDGKLENSELPVVVTIETGKVKPQEIPGIDEIYEHIRSLKGENEYTKETISHMQSCIDMTEIPYISFEDSNTKGLSGAEHGEKATDEDTWGIYAYKKGVHHVANNTDWENIRGGSHGVGKIACNAASDLHIMFFANCDRTGKEHLGGTIQLIEHAMGDSIYRSTGYFTRVVDNVYYPFENVFAPVFQKKTRGLKIVIPYLRQQFQDHGQIIRSVCDNFFVAILEKKLIVQVDNTIISSNTIKELVENREIYVEQDYSEIKNNFTPLYIKTYLESQSLNCVVSDKEKDYRFRLYFTYNAEIKKARVAIIRGIGMKIEDKKISNYVNAPFNAIMIPETPQEDTFLKTLENESHTSLSYEHIKNPKIQSNAKRFINNITREMQKKFADYLKDSSPTDGVMDTADVIYTVERNFKRELSKRMSNVQLEKGVSGKKRTIVKIKSEKTEKKDEQVRVMKDEKKKLRNKIRNELRKYQVPSDSVKRIVLKDREYLELNFENMRNYSNENLCQISLSVVDGVGKICENEFYINQNYSQIIDRNRSEQCSFEGNTIENVVINKGKVNLEFKLADYFNKSLKFMYLVEV